MQMKVSDQAVILTQMSSMVGAENVLDGIKTQFLCICVDMALCHIYSGDSKENQFTQSLHEDPPPLW